MSSLSRRRWRRSMHSLLVGRWGRTHATRRSQGGLLLGHVRVGSLTTATFLVQIDLAVHEESLVIFFVGVLVVILVVFLIHLRIRRWESWIDILRTCFMLCSLAALHAVDVGLLCWSILIKRTTDEVRRVWEVVLVFDGQASSIDRDSVRAVMEALLAMESCFAMRRPSTRAQGVQ